jgi:small subunit ribosomal protein S6
MPDRSCGLKGREKPKGELLMALYESVIIARQDIASTAVEALSDELTKIIEENSGSVVKCEQWGLKNLAYRIKKNRKGHYILLNIDAPADALIEYERRMRINEDILRYFSIRVDQHEEGPSVMLSSKTRSGPKRDGDTGHYESGRRDFSNNAGANNDSNRNSTDGEKQ